MALHPLGMANELQPPSETIMINAFLKLVDFLSLNLAFLELDYLAELLVYHSLQTVYNQVMLSTFALLFPRHLAALPLCDCLFLLLVLQHYYFLLCLFTSA